VPQHVVLVDVVLLAAGIPQAGNAQDIREDGHVPGGLDVVVAIPSPASPGD